MIDATSFQVSSSGNQPWIDAQADTWVTQVPHCCGGTRYGETGRSNRVSYPANSRWYFVQQAVDTVWLSPAYGCNWINWYNLGSQDYNCGYME